MRQMDLHCVKEVLITLKVKAIQKMCIMELFSSDKNPYF